MDGQRVLVQLFSWMMGEPTDVVAYSRDELYGSEVKLFADRDAWIAYIERIELANRFRGQSPRE